MESKVVAIRDKKISVREMTVREIKELADMSEDASVIDRLTKVLGLCASGAKPEDFLDEAPSDLQPLIDAMLEVNSSFFDQAAAIGMDAAGEALKQMIGAISMMPFASVSPTVTE